MPGTEQSHFFPVSAWRSVLSDTADVIGVFGDRVVGSPERTADLGQLVTSALLEQMRESFVDLLDT